MVEFGLGDDDDMDASMAYVNENYLNAATNGKSNLVFMRRPTYILVCMKCFCMSLIFYTSLNLGVLLWDLILDLAQQLNV